MESILIGDLTEEWLKKRRYYYVHIQIKECNPIEIFLLKSWCQKGVVFFVVIGLEATHTYWLLHWEKKIFIVPIAKHEAKKPRCGGPSSLCLSAMAAVISFLPGPVHGCLDEAEFPAIAGRDDP